MTSFFLIKIEKNKSSYNFLLLKIRCHVSIK